MKKFTFLFSFILLISVAMPHQSKAQVLEADSLALVALYNDCDGANWTGYDTWLNGPLSSWEGVTLTDVDGSMRVTEVNFKDMSLKGALPSALGNLTELGGRIELRDDELSGTFPSFMWNLSKVEILQIKYCQYSSLDMTGIEQMVSLKEFNTEGTPFEGEIPVGFFNLPSIQKIYLENGKWSSLPADMPTTTTTPLTRFYINGNQFTDLPDLTGMVWGSGAKIKLQDNQLTFEDIVPNMPIKDDTNVSGFTYSPQAVVGEDMITYADAGTAVTLESNIGGVATTVYTWMKGEEEVESTKDLTIASFDPATQSGTYFCFAQDPSAPGLDIMTGNKMLFENATAQDSLALVALYNECGGANWTGFDNWLNGALSTWEDVTVSDVEGTPRVTNVQFKNMTLTGTLPEELGSLTEMSGKIEINNQPGLTGTFPAFVWNWTKVERMQIKFCGFTAIDVTGMDKMVNLYEFNTQATPFAGEIPVEIFNLPKMRDVYLEDGMWTSLPADMPIPTPTPLKRFYINGNQFTDLPDLTGMVWNEAGAKIKFQNNMLTFEDIVPNMWIKDATNVSEFSYSPQAVVGEDMITYADAGTAVTLESNIGGVATTVYTWMKGEEEVESTKDLTIASFDPATQSGTYFCFAQDPSAPGLDIMTGNKMLFENATAQDSLALVALYNECGGANWTGFDNWLNGALSTWEDVTVSDVEGTPRVTNVQFKNMTLTGTLPEELGSLTEMSGKIEINNQPGLTGTFPAFVWNWTKVERMQIKFCGFTAIDVTGMDKMVNLYEFNTQATPFAGEIPVEIFNLPKMRDVYLEDGMWTSLPADMPIPTPTPLKRFYINGNQFTDLPDLTGMVWNEAGAKIKFQNNMLTFEDIVPNMWIKDATNVSEFSYSPQAVVGEDMITYADAGTAVTLESNIGGVATTVYTWMKGEEEVESTKDLTIASFDPATQSGAYFCFAQDPSAPGLDIMTGNKMLFENATAQDSLALVALYNECGGANWTGFDNWLNGALSTWEDVTVSDVEGTPRVTNVQFKNMTLTGTLPEELGSLTEMSGKIEINNQPGLTGTFPAFVWNWTKVERMQIKFCSFTAIDVTGMDKMVNLYEFNTQATPFAGEIPVEIFKLPKMRDVYMEDGMWSSLPADMPIPTPTPLKRFYINGNQFTDLPDLSGMVWNEAGAKIKFQNNMLTFEDLESNISIKDATNVSEFSYSPQALLTAKDTIDLTEGDVLELSVSCGGTQNIYTWLKNGEVIDGAESDSLSIASTLKEDSGEYQCLVQSALVPGLDLVSDTFSVVVSYPLGVESIEKSFFRVNGNPVHNILSIDSKEVIEHITIVDITGRTMKQELVNTTNLRMNVSDLRNGIYVIRLKGKTADSTLKIIKR